MNLKRRSQRTAPFLEKNWIAGVNGLQKSVMGVALSTPKHRVSFSPDDDGAPPQKRPRLSPSASVDIDQLLAAPDDSEDRPTLRIDVLKVFHKDSKKVRPLQTAVVPLDVLTTKGTCRITVFDVSAGHSRVLHCQSKTCDIKTYKNPIGPHRVARVDMPRPFFIPKDNILINRLDDDSHDFSESYRLLVELEAADNESWPPLEPHDFGIAAGEQGPLANPSKRHWVMSSEFESVFGRIKNPLRLTAGYHPQRPSRQTDYVMDVDLKWTSGLRPLESNKPCITAFDPDSENYTSSRLAPVNGVQTNGVESDHGINDIGVDAANGVNGIVTTNSVNGIATTNGVNGIATTNGVNGIATTNGVNGIVTTNGDGVVGNGINGVGGPNGNLHEGSSHELDEELDGEHTPTRALRTRGKNKVYNLKVLSDQAQGIERKRRARGSHATVVEGRVIYYLPVEQPVCLDYFRCITCGAYHETMPHLQLHLQTHHQNYDYALETTSQGPQFRVTRRLDYIASPTRTYQLGKPVQPFNLETFVAGDHSWVSSRVGPDNNEEPLRSPGPKPMAARQLFDKSSSRPPPSTELASLRPKRKRAVIPDSKRQFFDPVSKASLKPGDEVPSPVIDNSWLIQKHRENIREFSDVTPEEKDYIWKWDAFILEQGITVTCFLPRSWLEFVEQNASWLVAAPHRMIEFSKHMSVLLARDVLTDEVIDKAMLIVDTARTQAKAKKGERGLESNGKQTTLSSDSSSKQPPRASQVVRGANGCIVCQLPVLGPSLLLCSNKVRQKWWFLWYM